MKPWFLLIFLFFATEFLGLYVGSQYLQLLNSGVVQPVPWNQESVQTSFYLFGWIMVTTVGILILIRFRRSTIRLLEAFVIFTSSWLTFDLIMPVDIGFLSLGFFLALALTLWKAFKPSILSQNVAAIISGAGVGSLLGASLGVLPAVVFMLILSAYDFVSVFITKHMVYMAKALTERPTAFTIAAPPNLKSLTSTGMRRTRKSSKTVHVFQLGVGDMVIPLMFAVSVLNSFGVVNAVASIIGAAVALFGLIYFMSKKPRPLPALPFITFGTFAAFLLSMLL
jgi:presenilin-like A22 family membrane protease